ncbi:hypothetical protein IW262DRAFT_1462406 [Armillaria fumosa]|nr:hypothetical protein IW262DRAFT_1462406 [Armillaria fumosa]
MRWILQSIKHCLYEDEEDSVCRLRESSIKIHSKSKSWAIAPSKGLDSEKYLAAASRWAAQGFAEDEDTVPSEAQHTMKSKTKKQQELKKPCKTKASGLSMTLKMMTAISTQPHSKTIKAIVVDDDEYEEEQNGDKGDDSDDNNNNNNGKEENSDKEDGDGNNSEDKSEKVQAALAHMVAAQKQRADERVRERTTAVEDVYGERGDNEGKEEDHSNRAEPVEGGESEAVVKGKGARGRKHIAKDVSNVTSPAALAKK